MVDRHVGQDAVPQVENPRPLPPGLHQLVDATIQQIAAGPQQEGIQSPLDRLDLLHPFADLERAGGVQSDSVDLTWFPLDRFIAFRWPEVYPIRAFPPLTGGAYSDGSAAGTR